MKVAAGLFVSFLLMVGLSCTQQSTSTSLDQQLPPDNYAFPPWTSSEGLQIAIHTVDGETRLLTSGHQDYKPSWSTDGSQLTFFRRLEYEPGFGISRTKIGVINEDGTGLRLLTTVR